MISPKRDILVLLKNEFISERELESLHLLLHAVESPQHFCLSHELVDRNRISSRRDKLLKETRAVYLRPFRFLINKN